MGGGGERYAATDYSSVREDRRRQDTEEEKQKISFFLWLFFNFYAFPNYSTIKRGTKSHQCPLVLRILLVKSSKKRKRKI